MGLNAWIDILDIAQFSSIRTDTILTAISKRAPFPTSLLMSILFRFVIFVNLMDVNKILILLLKGLFFQFLSFFS